MLYRFSVVLTGAALAVGGLVAGAAGVASASTATPSPTVSPSATTPAPMTCPPALPISGSATAVTATSVTISYAMLLVPPCGYNPPVTVTLFTSLTDAQQWLNPVASEVSGPERYGTVTVDGLTPDTAYWFRFSADGHQDLYVIGSTRTAAVPVCTATFVITNRWSGGFLASMTVRNVSDQAIDSWQVAWRWSGDERIQSAWNAVVATDGADVTARNASYNGTLAPGASATFGMLAWGGGSTAASPTCGS